MREIVTTVYSFEELSEKAQRGAIESVQLSLSENWDSSDFEHITEAMRYKLAEVLKSPGWDTFGPADFPGIDGVELGEWDLERAELLVVTGVN